jgi:BASS family bile acid:Na+ symporter
MAEMLPGLLSLTIVLFMVGNVLETGLRLELEAAFEALHNVRFALLSVIWCFVLGPALAVVLTKIIPLPEPYALGLLLLGMAPCAPFLPMVAHKARGDLVYVAALMLISAAGTVILMPFMVPWLCKGFSADAWTIAKPLLFFIVTPLVIGIAIRRAAQDFAERACPFVKKATDVDTLAMCVLALWLYWRDILSAVGSYAIGTQFLYFGLLAAASYVLAFRLPYEQRSVLSLGVATRNIGAALVPLFAVKDTDPRAVTMCVLATFVQLIAGLGTAAILARFAPSDPSDEGMSVPVEARGSAREQNKPATARTART